MTDVAPTTPRFVPLPHQREALGYLMGGGLRACLVWHRRAGKDLTLFNYTWVASQRRVGIYYYFYPTYAQGKKAIWYGMDEQGTRFLDYIPASLVSNTHDTDMRIHMVNGSIIQLIGSDNIDSIMSTNPVGCVFSEYALQDPKGWRFVLPILHKNGGWAAFAYTPRGTNHGYELYKNTLGDPRWFTQLLTIEDTGLIDPALLDEDRATGIPEEIIQQEYYCSFSVTNEGAYFGQQMIQAEEQGRITSLVYDPMHPVHTAWDFGVNDACSIWFIQTDGRTVWAIDFFEKANNQGLPFFARVLQERGYFYGTHLAPHDVSQRSFGTGDNTLQAGYNLGINFTRVPPEGAAIPKREQVQAAHFLIPRTFFDSERCQRGIDGLRNYEREWDSQDEVFHNKAKHNWASHIADAYMTLACGIDLIALNESRPAHSQGTYDPRSYSHYDSFNPRQSQREVHESDARVGGRDIEEFQRPARERPKTGTRYRILRSQAAPPSLRET